MDYPDNISRHSSPAGLPDYILCLYRAVVGMFLCFSIIYHKGCPPGIMVKAMNCGIVVREFVLQSHYYVHFRANTLGKGMNPLILPPAMGK